MSDIYYPDCSKCENKKGCCSKRCIDSTTKKRNPDPLEFFKNELSVINGQKYLSDDDLFEEEDEE